MRQAETDHRGHAIIEQVIADLGSGPWLNSLQVCRQWRLAGVIAAMAFNLIPAAGTIASYSWTAGGHLKASSRTPDQKRTDPPANTSSVEGCS